MTARLLSDIERYKNYIIILTEQTQKLSDDEFEKIKMHVHYSVKILEDIKQLKEITEIINPKNKVRESVSTIEAREIGNGNERTVVADNAFPLIYEQLGYDKEINEESEKNKLIENTINALFENKNLWAHQYDPIKFTIDSSEYS